VSTVAQVIAAAPSFARRAMDPHPRLSAKRDVGTEATMAWYCLQTEIAAALPVIGGTVESLTVFGQVVYRIVPLRHPTYSWLIADEIQVESLGWDYTASTGITAETDNKVTITFRSPNYGTSGDMPFVEFSGNVSPRMVQAPASAYQSGHQPFADDPEQANGADFTLTLHQMPTYNLGDWIAAANSTNSYPFMGCPADTVLYLGPQWSYSQQLGGTSSYRVGLGFKVSAPDQLWSYGYLSDGTWGQIRKTDGSPRYTQIDFNTLFVA